MSDVGVGNTWTRTDPRSHVIELESTIKSTMKLRQRRVRHDGLEERSSWDSGDGSSRTNRNGGRI